MNKLMILPVLLFLMSACNSDFLETSPTSSYDEEFVFSTTDKAYAVINGMHRSMVLQYGKEQHYGGYPSIMIVSEMLGEDVVLASRGNNYWTTEYQWKGHRSETGVFPFFAYHLFYKLITNANAVVENIDAATGPEGEKKMIKGQALTYRALSYFWLVQLYGKRYVAGQNNDNPAVSLIVSSRDGKKPRATVKEVYSRITRDLHEADSLLSSPDNTFARPVKNHFTPAVVRGLRARVALTMQDWAAASRYASEAINSSGCTLMTPEQYNSGFSSASNPEWMWAFEQKADQSVYFHGFMAVMSYNCNASQVKSNPKAILNRLYNQLPASDIRKNLWDPTGRAWELASGFSRAPYMNRKFKVADPSGSIADICFMRLAELYLILAEAKARLGNPDAADALFNLVSTRDPLYQRSGSTGEQLIGEILFQRRIELWGEGFRFTDLKRLGAKLDRSNSNHKQSLCNILTIEPDDKSWEFLIPQKELTANELVVQNPR